MERKTIGAFIAVLRKARGLTQRQLAEMLNVSDKTVSRWERDESCPDLSLIPVLAEIFSVSCDELLLGERRAMDETRETGGGRSEKQRRYLLSAALTRFKNRSCVAALLSLLGLTAAAAANFGFGLGRLGFFLGLMFFLAAGLCQLIFKNNALAAMGEDVEPGSAAFRIAVLRRTELILGLDLLLFSACLPLLTPKYTGASLPAAGWLPLAGCLAAAALALSWAVCWLLNGRLMERAGYALEGKAQDICRRNHRLKGRLALLLAALLLVTGFVHLSLTRIWGPEVLTESLEFDDLNSFARFMEEKGLPLESNHYNDNIRYYDEEGNEISFLEASRRYLTDGNCKVLMEYVLNQLVVCSVQASFRGDELLELRAFSCDYEELEQARATVRRQDGIFAAVYLLELAAMTAIYFRKRAK